jgi:hypothetical protein
MANSVSEVTEEQRAAVYTLSVLAAGQNNGVAITDGKGLKPFLRHVS